MYTIGKKFAFSASHIIGGDWIALDACLIAAAAKPRRALKLVIFDDADYAYARSVASRYPELTSYLQVGTPSPLGNSGVSHPETVDIAGLMGRLRWLVAKAVEDRWFAATVLPQFHVLAWVTSVASEMN